MTRSFFCKFSHGKKSEDDHLAKTADIVREFSEPIVNSLGLELWDVEFVKEAGEQYLRVYIDKEGGVSIDDCVTVHHALDPVLDEKDPIPVAYTFEVCSAGLERQLKTPAHFERFMGSPVSVRLYKAKDGVREFNGSLSGYSDGMVSITDKDGQKHSFSDQEIAAVKLRIEF